MRRQKQIRLLLFIQFQKPLQNALAISRQLPAVIREHGTDHFLALDAGHLPFEFAAKFLPRSLQTTSASNPAEYERHSFPFAEQICSFFESLVLRNGAGIELRTASSLLVFHKFEEVFLFGSREGSTFAVLQ